MAKKNEAAIYRPSLPPHEAVRTIRELQAMTQSQLAEASGIPQPTISAIESGRVSLGVERAKKLALALQVHPSVLLFSDWRPVLAPSRETSVAEVLVKKMLESKRTVSTPVRNAAGKIVAVHTRVRTSQDDLIDAAGASADVTGVHARRKPADRRTS